MKSIVCILFFLSVSLPVLSQVTLSGIVKDKKNNSPLPYVSLTLKNTKDSSFVTGGISNEQGLYSLTNINQGEYYIQVSYIGYQTIKQSVLVGSLSQFLDLGTIKLEEDLKTLTEVEVIAKQDEVNGKMDKKTFNVGDNTAQAGGSVLQSMKNLPGVTVDQNGKVQIRGSEKVTILIDGKQTALSGFDNQSSLDNIPASAIEKIEIINNPSAKYDANGNAGIINIIYKKNKQDGFSGKAGIAGGLGALWIKRENLPTIRSQFQNTPKVNPSLSINYRKKKVTVFFQGDYLYTQTLNKNEFVERNYDTLIIHQQTKRNRTTTIGTAKAGLDWNLSENNIFTISALFSSEKILDNGDEPFFNNDYTERIRLWQFLEDELKTTATASAAFQHKFKQPGHVLNVGYNYTFHREDEKYFFTNTISTFVGYDAFKLISDEHVSDLNIDYVRPLKYGRFETGMKFRRRNIPTNMQFIPGINSSLDTNAGGWANYTETIPAVYGTYVYESKKIEFEAGLRVEYVDVQYKVNPEHSTYKSDGYNYTQPFPNLRFAFKINDKNKISLFYNRRVDRPGEVDIRIFPKYDDAEILKVGNPALNPQFTNSLELGYKTRWKNGYFYSALYHRISEGTITRIATTVPGSSIIYSIMQNAGKSYNTGVELVFTQDVKKWLTINLSLNGYENIINGFTVENKYPVSHKFTADRQQQYSGNIKFNGNFHLRRQFDIQVTSIYLAPDIIPQGKIDQRYSLDIGIKKAIQKGKGEVFMNATDILNTMVIKKEIKGEGFKLISSDYYETQVFRIGYNYKF
ncbi:MAG: TonB-dependent receptor [Bacteroidota bacterium]|nr:TonB-dependent receptor [Bacteroidota bacterium]